MANDLNQCNFIGRLSKDPEQKSMPNGNAVTNITLAVGEQWKDKNSGQKQESVEWVRIVAFGRLAEIMGQYTSKGSRIFVTGKMKTRKWQDQSGNDRYSTEIVANNIQLLDTKGSNQGQQGAQQQNSGYQQNNGGGQQQQPQQQQARQQAPSQMDDFDDDIPF